MNYRIVRDDRDRFFYVEWFGKSGFLAFLQSPRWHRVTGCFQDYVYDRSFQTEQMARDWIDETERRKAAGTVIVAEISAEAAKEDRG